MDSEGRRQLRETAHRRVRQTRRGRRERIEMKHDERSRKADTDETQFEAAANSETNVIFDLSRTWRPALDVTSWQVGNFPEVLAKSHTAFSEARVTERTLRRDRRSAEALRLHVTHHANRAIPIESPRIPGRTACEVPWCNLSRCRSKPAGS